MSSTARGAAAERAQTQPAARSSSGGPGELASGQGAPRRRRVPAQARSRERVRRLLETADGFIGSEGFGALTIPELAARARVPVGSIYQFFPDKPAIVDAVAARYMELFLDELKQLSDKIATLPWQAAVELVIEHFAGMYRAHPTFGELLLHGQLSPGGRERDRRNNDELAEVLVSALGRRPEFRRARRLRLGCRVAVEIADALLRHAFTLNPMGDQATLDELKRNLSGYLLQFATRTSPR